MTGRELLELGVPPGAAVNAAQRLAKRHGAQAVTIIERVLHEPRAHHGDDDPLVRAFAQALVAPETAELRDTPAPFTIFGEELIDPTAIEQMSNAMRLPGAIVGALMPDAHVGYGLPIGGVTTPPAPPVYAGT